MRGRLSINDRARASLNPSSGALPLRALVLLLSELIWPIDMVCLAKINPVFTPFFNPVLDKKS